MGDIRAIQEWRRWAALGQWSKITLSELYLMDEEDAGPQELEDLRWALEKVIPTECHGTGRFARWAPSDREEVLRRHVEGGAYAKALAGVRGRLAPDARASKIELHIRDREDARAADELSKGTSMLERDTQRSIRELRHAKQLLVDLRNLIDEEDEYEPASLTKAEEAARAEFAAAGIDLPRLGFEHSLWGMEQLFVKPTADDLRKADGATPIKWEVRHLPAPDDGTDQLDSDSLSDADRAGLYEERKRYASQRRELTKEGWRQLSDLASSDCALFDTRLARAAAVLLLVRGYKIQGHGPTYDQIVSIDAHLSKKHLSEALAARSPANPNEKGSIKPESCAVLRAMEEYIGDGKSVERAAQLTKSRKNLGTSPSANSALYHKHKKLGTLQSDRFLNPDASVESRS